MKGKWKRFWPVKLARKLCASELRDSIKLERNYGSYLPAEDVKRYYELTNGRPKQASVEVEKIIIEGILTSTHRRHDAAIVERIAKTIVAKANRAELRATHQKGIEDDPEFHRLQRELIEMVGGKDELELFNYTYELIRKELDRKARYLAIKAKQIKAL